MTEHVIDWYGQFDYECETGTALPYDKQSARYIEARRYYKICLNRFNTEKIKPKGSNNLQNVKDQFKRRKKNG